MGLIFDLVIGLSLIGVAWRIVRAREHFQSIVLFITFGMLLSLAWTRLKSPDIAIAEAAVGAGLAGVLLMDALGAFSSSQDRPTHGKSFALLIPFAVLAGLMAFAIMFIPDEFQGLGPLVRKSMPDTHLEYPVTAVLLDFRGYDTWLELGVLLVAVLGVLCVRNASTIKGSILPAPAEPVGRWIIKLLLPLMVLIGGYLLWLGAFAPGGAFQAGVVLASAGVMLWQAGHPSAALLPRLCWKIILSSGFVFFLILALSSMFFNDQFMSHPEAKIWILGLEYAATLSIALCLISLVLASPGRNQGMKTRRPKNPEKILVLHTRRND
jgi:multisubunit Na+/H+ antiporter MnhB subunit